MRNLKPQPPNTLRNQGGADLPPPCTLETAEGPALNRVKVTNLGLRPILITKPAGNPLREKETRSRPRKYLSMKIEVQVGTGMIHKDGNLFLVL